MDVDSFSNFTGESLSIQCSEKRLLLLTAVIEKRKAELGWTVRRLDFQLIGLL